MVAATTYPTVFISRINSIRPVLATLSEIGAFYRAGIRAPEPFGNSIDQVARRLVHHDARSGDDNILTSPRVIRSPKKVVKMGAAFVSLLSCGKTNHVIRTSRMPSATIQIFLVHGDPKRLRTAEISNWTGKAIAGPRTEFDSILARDECGSSGVYFLTGNDPDTGAPAVYVGESECIRDRVKNHVAKDFWNHIIFFMSKDENLTKSHIRYLEGRLIEQAQQAGRATVQNGQGSGSKLPESDRQDMEIYLEKIHQLLPALGVEVLVPTSSKPEVKAEQEFLSCEIHGLRATGHLTPNGIVVLAGSQAVLEPRASAQQYPWVVNARQRLMDEGVLRPDSGALYFMKDTEFSSPSAAAAVIHGGTANGRTAWKNQVGKTLKDLEFA
jgi:hypothetical protein